MLEKQDEIIKVIGKRGEDEADCKRGV